MSQYLTTVSTLELYAMLGVCETDRALSEADALEMAECAKRIRAEIANRVRPPFSATLGRAA